MKITLPPLPPLDFDECSDDTTFACDAGYSPETLRARDIEVARLVLEAAALVCDEVAVDATSEKRMKFLTVQGKAVHQGMYGGAINCAGGIRALEVSHD